MIALVQTLLVLVFPVLVILGAVKDATSYTIPNWISLGLIAGYPLAALALGVPLATMGLNLAIGGGALVLGMAMFAMGWIGGGDAKLFAAAALWLGLPALMTYGFVTCLAGGALTLGLLGMRSGWVRPFLLTGPAWVVRLAEPAEAVPYGLAIAAGALVAFPEAAMLRGLALPL